MGAGDEGGKRAGAVHTTPLLCWIIVSSTSSRVHEGGAASGLQVGRAIHRCQALVNAQAYARQLAAGAVQERLAAEAA